MIGIALPVDIAKRELGQEAIVRFANAADIGLPRRLGAGYGHTHAGIEGHLVIHELQQVRP